MCRRDCAGRAAVITGASQGLGLAIAGRMSSAGASVLHVRPRWRPDRAASDARATRGAGQRSRGAWPADVSAEAESGAGRMRRSTAFGRVRHPGQQRRRLRPDGADRRGRLGRVGARDRNQPDGFGLCCRALLCRISRRTGMGRSSSFPAAARPDPLPRISAYAASKAAVVRFAETLAQEVRGVRHRRQRDRAGRAEHPAAGQVLAAGPGARRRGFLRSLAAAEGGGRSTARRAARRWPCSSASAASDGITGELISAVWDPWRIAGRSHLADLDGLGRLHPAADRARATAGMAWGEIDERLALPSSAAA